MYKANLLAGFWLHPSEGGRARMGVGGQNTVRLQHSLQCPGGLDSILGFMGNAEGFR